MEMKDYLNGTSDTVDYLLVQINKEIKKFEDVELDLAEFDAVESYLRTGDNTLGQRAFEEMSQQMCEPPTVSEVIYWKNQLKSMHYGSLVAIDTMCSSILMIAQAGVKLVFGSPRDWELHLGVECSSRGECLFQAIWHGRNLAAHVEGLDPRRESYLYFQNVELRCSINLLAGETEFKNRIILRDLLGWVESDRNLLGFHKINGLSAFHQDMLRIGELV